MGGGTKIGMGVSSVQSGISGISGIGGIGGLGARPSQLGRVGASGLGMPMLGTPQASQRPPANQFM